LTYYPPDYSFKNIRFYSDIADLCSSDEKELIELAIIDQSKF